MVPFLEIVIRLIKENKLVFGVGFAGCIALLWGIISLFSSPKQEPLQFASSGGAGISQVAGIKSEPTAAKKVYIDVSGAVNKPGVYTLDSESRVTDALLAAGGMSDKADRLRVSQTINLAAKVNDGAKLYIPSLGEAQVTSQGVVKSSFDTSSDVSTAATININQASETELDTLPGIGQVTAEKIIANRPYQTIAELTQKKVVGTSVFEKIKDKISVY